MPTTHYLWDFDNDSYLTEKDETVATTAVYTNGPVPFGNLISQRRSSATSYYHFDGHGSTQQLTDQNQTGTDEYTYAAFGEVLASSGTTTNPFGFRGSRGYYSDSHSGDLYVRARSYAPRLVRWLSVDPSRFSGYRNVVGLYVYVDNCPTLFGDPSGLQKKRDCPKCPTPWNAPKVVIQWQYGCYCGKEPTPPRKKIDAPIDAADTACKKHDQCCGAAKSSDDRIRCNEDLVKDAGEALAKGCDDAPDIACCCKAAKDIIAAFKEAGAKYC